jgi:uncharacterized repeat protein (TIGR01451 family)
MPRTVRSALVIAGVFAAVALSACSDATDPVPARALGPTQPSRYFAQGSMLVTPDTMDFGTVLLGTESAPQTITIQNVGTAPLEMWDLSGIGPGDFLQVLSRGDCEVGQLVQPSAQCTLVYKFKPIAAGARAGFVLLLASDGSADTVQFRGTSYTDADVAVSIAASSTVAQVGKPLTYTIRLENNGPGMATGITLTDVLPPMTAFQSISSAQKTPPCTTPPVGATGTVSCPFAWIPAGSTLTYELVVIPNGGRYTSIGNTAVVTTTSADAVKSNDAASVTVQAKGKK